LVDESAKAKCEGSAPGSEGEARGCGACEDGRGEFPD
jgi:hypothetical protein